MPGIVRIVRGADAPTLTRGNVAQGMIFSVVNGKNNYAAIGHNGRMYSLNLATGELASSANENSQVTLRGKWVFNVDRNFRYGVNRVGQLTTRSDVRPGEVFRVKDGADDYAHMGRINRDKNGWLSVPLARPTNHAVTTKGDSHVTIVGTFTVDATLTK